jgi:hypothetical protein
MKRKHSKPPAVPQEGVPNPLARITIREIAPDPDQIEEWIKDDPAYPARLSRFVQASVKHIARRLEDAPLIQKGKKRAEVEKHTIVEANQKRQRKAAVKYEKIRKFAGEIIDADPKLQRASANRLAIKIHKQRPEWPERTIRRALAPKK